MLKTPLTPELSCTDIKRSLAFYVGVLGFSIQYERPEEGFAMLERQGTRLMLDEMRAGTRTWLTGSMEPPFGRGVNFQIETTAVDDLYAKVRAAGIPVFMEIEEKWYRRDGFELGNRQFLAQDPDGYLLRFFEDLGSRKRA